MYGHQLPRQLYLDRLRDENWRVIATGTSSLIINNALLANCFPHFCDESDTSSVDKLMRYYFHQFAAANFRVDVIRFHDFEEMWRQVHRWYSRNNFKIDVLYCYLNDDRVNSFEMLFEFVEKLFDSTGQFKLQVHQNCFPNLGLVRFDKEQNQLHLVDILISVINDRQLYDLQVRREDLVARVAQTFRDKVFFVTGYPQSSSCGYHYHGKVIINLEVPFAFSDAFDFDLQFTCASCHWILAHEIGHAVLDLSMPPRVDGSAQTELNYLRDVAARRGLTLQQLAETLAYRSLEGGERTEHEAFGFVVIEERLVRRYRRMADGADKVAMREDVAEVCEAVRQRLATGAPVPEHIKRGMQQYHRAPARYD